MTKKEKEDLEMAKILKRILKEHRGMIYYPPINVYDIMKIERWLDK